MEVNHGACCAGRRVRSRVRLGERRLSQEGKYNMMQGKHGLSTWRAFGIGLVPLAILCACSVDATNGEGSAESEWISGSDAAAMALKASDAAPQSDLGMPDGSPGAGPDLQDKNACTYIEWCNAPASASASGYNWGTICRVRSGCAIPNSGCTSDAYAVCGGITQLALQIRVGQQIP